MKKILLTAALCVLTAGSAHAEITGLSVKFKGGCKESNTNGSCTIAASATGEDLGSDAVLLQRADTQNGRYKNVSSPPKSLSDSGSTTFRFRNNSGCYRAVNSENGNGVRDIHSRAVCEK